MLDKILEILNQPTNDPACFIRKNVSHKDEETFEVMNDVFRKITDRKNKISEFLLQDLDKFHYSDFDSEQIWQQLELKNRSLFNYIPELAILFSSRDEVIFPLQNYGQNNNNKSVDLASSEEDEYEEENNDDADDYDSDRDDVLKSAKNKTISPESVTDDQSDSHPEDENDDNQKLNDEDEKENSVDDKFFNLNEMKAFLDKQERIESNSNERNDNNYVDYFQDISTDEEAENLKYKDFFEDPRLSKEKSKKRKMYSDYEKQSDSETEYKDGKKVRFSFKPTDNDDAESSKPLSSFEMKQSKLKNRISKLEEEVLGEKPWQLRGEVDASNRPINSLLEEVVEYDITQRPAPVITEEVTQTLESIILSRIKDAAYDDVVRKIKPIQTPGEYKKELVLNQQKSKISLAEIYEQEYLKQKQKQDNDEETDKNELSEEKKIIKKMMNSLFQKLDTLSNFHYTPKLASADLKVVNNLPAIIMEEAIPAAISDANLLAPEEISSSTKRPLLGKDERTATDKKRERRKKKSFQARKFKKELKTKSGEGKVKELLKRRNVNMAVLDNTDKSVTSSTKFFSQLQDEVQRDIQGKNKKKEVKKNYSAKLLKL